MTRRRELTPEDAELWRFVTRNVDPYHSARHLTEEPPAPPPVESKRPAVIRPHEIAAKPPAALPSLSVGKVTDMDKRTARRLKRGELPVDGRLDLHSLTLDQAHGALTGFIRGAYGRGARCVVVVTGKGKSGEGKIRRETPHWLNQPALRPLVLAVTEARTYDGGSGAFYVLLKRKR
ncbi:MAG: Smr/MutS family protein [Rhodospirillaceae bacterium]|nr:Smr/MutS family protein [Rhodospirillaceae bacterium]